MEPNFTFAVNFDGTEDTVRVPRDSASPERDAAAAAVAACIERGTITLAASPPGEPPGGDGVWVYRSKLAGGRGSLVAVLGDQGGYYARVLGVHRGAVSEGRSGTGPTRVAALAALVLDQAESTGRLRLVSSPPTYGELFAALGKCREQLAQADRAAVETLRELAAELAFRRKQVARIAEIGRRSSASEATGAGGTA